MSSIAQSAAPFCFGLPVRKGDVPSGQSIGASIPNAQVVIKNRWPDGSAKFAVVSGRIALAANSPSRISFAPGGAAGNGAPLTEADLQAAGVTGTLTFGAAGTVDLGSLIGVASTYNATVRRWSAGRVRQWIAGPEMSSWLYYSPIGSDTSLTAWFEVRLWRSGAVEVLPWIENGWLKAAGPTSKSGRMQFSLGAVMRYDSASAIDLPHHCRCALASGSTLSHWLGQDPQVRFSHDTSYVQSTRLVPTYYASGALNSALLSRLAESYQPLAQASYPAGMGAGGYHGSIGLLPEWDVAYLVSGGDTRALTAVIVNGYAAGRYPMHYRDELTNRPMRFSDHPTLVLDGTNSSVPSSGASSANDYTPSPGGTAPPAWTTSHHPSVGYLAYLVTGRYYFCEQVQFSATLGYLKQSDAVRNRAEGFLETAAGANTTRGAAWSLRTLAQACCVAPDDDSDLRPEFINSITKNVERYHQRYVATANNPQGICKPYSDYSPGSGVYEHAIWMEDFLTAAWGYMTAMEVPVSPATTLLLRQFFEWKARSIVGRFGSAAPSDYYYAEAAKYTLPVAPSDSANWDSGAGPWYPTWGAVFGATTKDGTTSSTSLRGAYFPEVTSYWGNLQPALAYAVDLGVPGALEGYRRMTGAPNWGQFRTGLDANPVWGVMPRLALS